MPDHIEGLPCSSVPNHSKLNYAPISSEQRNTIYCGQGRSRSASDVHLIVLECAAIDYISAGSAQLLPRHHFEKVQKPAVSVDGRVAGSVKSADLRDTSQRKRPMKHRGVRYGRKYLEAASEHVCRVRIRRVSLACQERRQ